MVLGLRQLPSILLFPIQLFGDLIDPYHTRLPNLPSVIEYEYDVETGMEIVVNVPGAQLIMLRRVNPDLEAVMEKIRTADTKNRHQTGRSQTKPNDDRRDSHQPDHRPESAARRNGLLPPKTSPQPAPEEQPAPEPALTDG